MRGVENKRKLGGGRGEDLYRGMEPEVTSVAHKATGMVRSLLFSFRVLIDKGDELSWDVNLSHSIVLRTNSSEEMSSRVML